MVDRREARALISLSRQRRDRTVPKQFESMACGKTFIKTIEIIISVTLSENTNIRRDENLKPHKAQPDKRKNK
jgi:hypothetical protein